MAQALGLILQCLGRACEINQGGGREAASTADLGTGKAFGAPGGPGGRGSAPEAARWQEDDSGASTPSPVPACIGAMYASGANMTIRSSPRGASAGGLRVVLPELNASKGTPPIGRESAFSDADSECVGFWIPGLEMADGASHGRGGPERPALSSYTELTAMAKSSAPTTASGGVSARATTECGDTTEMQSLRDVPASPPRPSVAPKLAFDGVVVGSAETWLQHQRHAAAVAAAPCHGNPRRASPSGVPSAEGTLFAANLHADPPAPPPRTPRGVNHPSPAPVALPTSYLGWVTPSPVMPVTNPVMPVTPPVTPAVMPVTPGRDLPPVQLAEARAKAEYTPRGQHAQPTR